MPDDPRKPFNPEDDDFLRSLGGLLDEPLDEESPAEPLTDAVEDEDPFALPDIPLPSTPRPERPAPKAVDSGVSDDFFALPTLPGQLRPSQPAPSYPTEPAESLVPEAPSTPEPEPIVATEDLEGVDFSLDFLDAPLPQPSAATEPLTSPTDTLAVMRRRAAALVELTRGDFVDAQNLDEAIAAAHQTTDLAPVELTPELAATEESSETPTDDANEAPAAVETDAESLKPAVDFGPDLSIIPLPGPAESTTETEEIPADFDLDIFSAPLSQPEVEAAAEEALVTEEASPLEIEPALQEEDIIEDGFDIESRDQGPALTEESPEAEAAGIDAPTIEDLEPVAEVTETEEATDVEEAAGVEGTDEDEFALPSAPDTIASVEANEVEPLEQDEDEVSNLADAKGESDRGENTDDPFALPELGEILVAVEAISEVVEVEITTAGQPDDKVEPVSESTVSVEETEIGEEFESVATAVEADEDDLDDVFAMPEVREVPPVTEVNPDIEARAGGPQDDEIVQPNAAKRAAVMAELGMTDAERAQLDAEFNRSERAHRAGAGEDLEEDASPDEDDPFALEAVPITAKTAADDLLAAMADVAPAPPKEPTLPRESLAERMGADLSVRDHEETVEDLSLPTFQHETPEEIDPEAGPLVIRRRIVDQAESVSPSASRFPIIAGVREAAYRLWNGPLGWKSRPEDVGYVTLKAFLRLSIAFVFPVLLAFVVFGLPASGSAYVTQSLNPSGSEVRWSRGLVELPAPFTVIALPEGGQLPSTAVPILTYIYASFFTEYDAAVASGDTTALDALLTPDFAAHINAEIADLRSHGYTRVMYGYGPSSDDFFLRSGIPGSAPTDVLASVGSLTNVIILDASGNEVSNQFYSSFDAHFSRLNDRTWRLNSLTFNPELPIETPEVEPTEPPLEIPTP